MFGSLCSCVSSSVLTKPSRAAQATTIPSSAACDRPLASRRAASHRRRLAFTPSSTSRAAGSALMISSHAIGLANVPADGVLRSNFWVPRGWSTVGFQVRWLHDRPDVHLRRSAPPAPHVGARRAAGAGNGRIEHHPAGVQVRAMRAVLALQGSVVVDWRQRSRPTRRSRSSSRRRSCSLRRRHGCSR
jgi:hypothetical protein